MAIVLETDRLILRRVTDADFDQFVDAWGKGYATEGSRALVDKAFGELGATRVWAGAMAVNAASRRVMEKAGLRFVRLFHADWPCKIPGDEHGDVEYAITREEWLDRRDGPGQ